MSWLFSRFYLASFLLLPLFVLTCKSYRPLRFLSMKEQHQKKYTKSNLPVKICEQCGRPMEWRKAWAKNWDEVKYCSDRCRRDKRSLKAKNDTTTIDNKSGAGISDSTLKKNPSSYLHPPNIVRTLLLPLSIVMSLNAWNANAAVTSKPSAEELRTVFDPSIAWMDDESTAFHSELSSFVRYFPV